MALHDALLSEDVPSKKAPHQYAVKKAKDLQSSILQQTGLEASEHKRKRFKRAKQQSYFVLVVHGAICSLSFVLGAVAIYIDALILQRIAMLFPLVLAPYTFIQRRKIEQCGALRSAINEIRAEVNEFSRQNLVLDSERQRLEQNVSRLCSTDEKLRNIVHSQDSDIVYLIYLMKENQKTLEHLNKIQQQRIMQDLIKAIIRSDEKDPDFHIDVQEMEELVLRMRYLHGVNFDEATFRCLIRDKSIGVGQRRKIPMSACLQAAKTMLETKQTNKFYGKNQVLQNLVFHIEYPYLPVIPHPVSPTAANNSLLSAGVKTSTIKAASKHDSKMGRSTVKAVQSKKEARRKSNE